MKVLKTFLLILCYVLLALSCFFVALWQLSDIGPEYIAVINGLLVATAITYFILAGASNRGSS